MLFQINRDELNKVIAGYQPYKHTKKAIQGFQKDMADIEKYAASIEKEKAEKQLQLTKVLVDMDATFDLGERVYLQNEQEHLSKELQALDFFLEETKERKSQVRLKHATAVAQAIDEDRKELHDLFYEGMNEAVRVGLSDIVQCVADVSVKAEAEQKDFIYDVYDCLGGDEVVRDTYHLQNKTINTETPLDIGYLQIMPSHFGEARNGHNTVKSNSFIVRDYCKEGGNE